jgi:DNA polymerase elongation subunit (family B)
VSWTYFDIETLPDQRPGAREKAAASIKVPGNYKNPEAIAKYVEENAEEAYLKTALDGWKGHVACISYNGKYGSMSYCAPSISDEYDLIREFFSFVSMSHGTLVGHNIIGFDIPFITRRALVLGVQLPPDYIWPRNLKPWDKGVFDTMHALGNGKDYVSLNALADAFGIEGKINHGGAVYKMWQDGLHDEIAEYCADDTRIVREIHERMLKAGW